METTQWSSGAVVVGCRENTAEFIDGLLGHQCPVAGVVTISRETANRSNVPSWVDLSREFAGHLPVYVASTYRLDGSADRSALAAPRGDVGFCIGWQRLLPKWFLDRHRHGVFGMHACATMLPDGRGRSPINWALIEGADVINAHIFRYTDVADSGDLLAVVPMPIEPHDDIHTLQQKARVVFTNEVVDRWDDLLSGAVSLQPLRSPADGDRVLPRRSAVDGLIDWSWPATPITNWVRAQTRPYPGAFTVHDHRPCRIWRCGPAGIEHEEAPGTVLERFRDGTFIACCGHRESVHVLDHELSSTLACGQTLGG